MTQWLLPVLVQFWPETAVGWLALVGALCTGIGAAIAIHYAVKIKPVADQVQRWQPRGETPIALLAEVNAIGAKVTAIEQASARMGGERDQRLAALELTARDHENEIRQSREAVAECRQWMERVSAQQQDMREQIVGHISTATGKLADEVHKLDKSVAVLAEQVRHLREERE